MARRRRRVARSSATTARRAARARGPATFGLLAALLLPLPLPVVAHPLAPALLEITESASDRIEVRWKSSRWQPAGPSIIPVLPASCRSIGEATVDDDATARITRWTAQCERPLVGSRIGVDGLTATNAILRVHLRDGRVVQSVLDADNPRFVIPPRPQPLAVARGYAALGIEHIALGLDHLLFVFGLLLLARTWRALIATITAFTLGHSATLALATLGYADVPSAPVELLIAGTILWLANELARTDGSRPSWMHRRPGRIAAGFGLLHGLGFSGALHEVGLPQGEVPLALFSFNVGIEIGQLAFVAIVVGGEGILRPWLRRLPPTAARVPAYAMGTVAAYWCFERAAVLLAA